MHVMGIIILAIGVPFSLYVLYRIHKDYRENPWMQKSESLLLAEILAKSLIEVKKRMDDSETKYLEDCGWSPSECSDYHLPGDCPLCGAQ